MLLRAFLALSLVTVGAARADEPRKKNDEEAAAKAKGLVEKHLQALKAEGMTVRAVTEDQVSELFTNHVWIAVHFRQWPVAIQPPEMLKVQNLFVVDKSGKLTQFTDSKGLEKFFQANLDKAQPAMVVRAWLRLSTEFIQDGFYKFKILDDIKDTSVASSFSNFVGTAEVVPEMGNKGYLKVEIRFGRENQMGAVKEENKVVRGIRPRCQAKLLLHADPTIRAIAEQDLLVLGRAGRAYLMDQRAQAGPELRQAIDRIWKQIEEEGR